MSEYTKDGIAPFQPTKPRATRVFPHRLLVLLSYGERDHHILDIGILVLQRGPVSSKTFTPSVDDRSLGHQIQIRRDCSARFQGGLDPALEVSRRTGSVLVEDLEDAVADKIEILLWVQTEHVDDARREEIYHEGVVTEYEILENSDNM